MVQMEAVFTAGDSITPGFAAKLSREAENHKAMLSVLNGSRKLRLDSLISILAMEIKRGSTVTVIAEGEDEQTAAEAICAILRG